MTRQQGDTERARRAIEAGRRGDREAFRRAWRALGREEREWVEAEARVGAVASAVDAAMRERES